MFDELLRDIKEKYLIPLATLLAKFVTPNQITILGFALGLLSVVYVPHSYLLANLFWWLNRLCDGVDGVIARVSGQQSDLGAFLDIGFDFTIYAAIPIAIAASQPNVQHLMLVVSIMEGTYFVNAGLLFHAAALCEKRAMATKKGT
jgi:phosphatidylglycerophosphate synthase